MNKIKHLFVVCAQIEENGKILCCKRGKNRAFEGYYEFPGGKIEKNESKEEALIREIKEELKIDIIIVEYLGKSFYQYRNIQPFDDFDITLYAYKCKIKNGTLTLTEHYEMVWLTKDEMANYQFTPADMPFIKENDYE